MSLSFLVWGVLVRTVLTWHVTWTVNSLSHVWGYKNYQTLAAQLERLKVDAPKK